MVVYQIGTVLVAPPAGPASPILQRVTRYIFKQHMQRGRAFLSIPHIDRSGEIISTCYLCQVQVRVSEVALTVTWTQTAFFPQAAVRLENLPERYQTWQASCEVTRLARVGGGKQRNRVLAH